MTDTKTKFNDIIYNKRNHDTISNVGFGNIIGSSVDTTAGNSFKVTNSGGNINDIYVGDNPSMWNDHVDIDPGFYQNQPYHSGWSTGTDIDTSKAWEDQQKIAQIIENIKGEQKVANRLDKDLVKGKMPFNLKKDSKNNLYYEFACAGYDKVLLQKVKDGINITLTDKPDDDDLIGDDYEYVCKGIKMGKQDAFIFIDQDLYDLNNYTAKIKSGILTVFVPLKKVNKMDFLSISEEEDDTELKLI